ncbi:hypothetical protein JTF08_11020 [Micrococcaceae bacterium RIT802]|nr:hypothetical protein [Micrococcaceae bacterium RIT 802]
MDEGPEPAAKLFLAAALTLVAGMAIYQFGPLIPPNEGIEDNSTTVLLIGVAVALIGAVVLLVATYRLIGSIDYLVRRSEAGDRSERTEHPSG